MITPQIVNHKAYTPPVFLPERCLILSARCGKKPGGSNRLRQHIPSEPCSRKTENVTISDVTLEGNPCSNSSTLLSRDWTLASSILGSSERRACLWSLTRRPLRLPILWRRCFGSATGIKSIVLGGGPNKRIRFGKVVFLVVMLVS